MNQRGFGVVTILLMVLGTGVRADWPNSGYAAMDPSLLSSQAPIGYRPIPVPMWTIDRSDTWQVLRKNPDSVVYEPLGSSSAILVESKRLEDLMSSWTFPSDKFASLDAFTPPGFRKLWTLYDPISLPHLGGAVVGSSLTGAVPGAPSAIILPGTTIGRAASDLLAVGTVPIDPTPIIPRAILRHADSYTLRFQTRTADTIELTARFLLAGESREAALQRARSSNAVESVHVTPSQHGLWLGSIFWPNTIPNPEPPPARWFRFDLP